MKFFVCALALAAFVQVCTSQFVPPSIVYAPIQDPSVLPNKAVELNAANDALLPPELLKSKRFYDNPAIAAGLAKSSWFGDKEMPVHHREAERISRDKIYKLAKDAGFINRRRR